MDGMSESCLRNLKKTAHCCSQEFLYTLDIDNMLLIGAADCSMIAQGFSVVQPSRGHKPPVEDPWFIQKLLS